MDQLRPEELRIIAGRYFTVVGLHYDEKSVFLPITADQSEEQRDQGFDGLRRELMPRGYIPTLVQDQGELGLYITARPPMKYRSIRVNVVMLCLTLVTTIIAGAYSWASYEGIPLFATKTLLYGSLFFSLPLMLILGLHELSHYLAARRHGVAASLPFFIPAFPPLGTFGAFISMRDPIPDRKALMDIGVAGPLVGFVMTILVTIAGLYLTEFYHIPPSADTGGLIFLGTPIFFDILSAAMGYSSNWLLHPTAFAGWVGFLVTSLNLLPAGQLDGGHVARAFLGERARYAGWAAIIVLVLLSLFSGYPGWIVFILLILFLGLYHPPPLNDLAKLDLRTKALGFMAVVVLFGAFIPVPLTQVPPTYGVEMVCFDTESNVELNATVNYTFYILNEGNVGVDMLLDARFEQPDGRDAGWTARPSRDRVFVGAADYQPVNLTVGCPESIAPGNLSRLNLTVHPDAGGAPRAHLVFNTTAGFVKLVMADDVTPKYALAPNGLAGAPVATFSVSLANLVNDTSVPPRMQLTITNDSASRGQAGWSAFPDGSLLVDVEHGAPLVFGFSVWPPPGTPPESCATYTLRVSSALRPNWNDSLDLTVMMGQVHSVEMEANRTNITVPVLQSSTVGIWVTNRGNLEDTFNYTTRSSAGFLIGFPYEGLRLAPGQTAQFNMTVHVSAEATPGLNSVTLSVFSIAGGDADSVTIGVYVPPPAVHSIGVGANLTEVTLGRGQNATVAVTVTNTGGEPETVNYTMLVPAGLGAVLPYGNLALGPGESATLSLTISAATNATVGPLSVVLMFSTMDAVPASASVTVLVNVL